MAIVFAKKQTESLRYCSRGQRPWFGIEESCFALKGQTKKFRARLDCPFRANDFVVDYPRALPSAMIVQAAGLNFFQQPGRARSRIIFIQQ